MEEVLMEFLKLPSGNVADVLSLKGLRGHMDHEIRPVISKSRVCGRAATIKLRNTKEAGAIPISALFDFIDTLEPGQVLVVETGLATDNSGWGELMSAAVQRRGSIGAIVDGAIRDVDDIRRLNYPVYSRSICCAGLLNMKLEGLNVGVSCGGIIVNPGDIILGDDDGVVVIPAAMAEEVLAETQNFHKAEEKVVSALKTDISTWCAFQKKIEELKL